MSHREALESIIKICRESSEFSRRTQACLNTAMIALGYTENQRTTVFTKCAMRAEKFKELKNSEGVSAAKKYMKDAVLEDTGEPKQQIKKKVMEEYL